MLTPEIDPGLRIWALIGIFAVLALILAGQLVRLTLIEGPARAEEAKATRLNSMDLPARRGTIYDRNGKVLATSINAKTVYCNPKEVSDPQGEAAIIAATIGGDMQEYVQQLSMPESGFAYIARKIDEDLGASLDELGLDGIYVVADSKRVYPNGSLAGQIIGICDIDGKGLTGLELQYDELLSGEDGEVQIERGANGLPIAGGIYTSSAARNGSDIYVSIDLEMQEYLEARLDAAVHDIEGKRGQAILYDGATGEIVAIASTPYLNPQDRDNIQEGATELMGISTAFEPGSIFKTVTAAAILEEGIMDPADKVDCPAVLHADEYVITDAHERLDETMTFREILARSSNVGISLCAEKLGFDRLYDYIERYGLTEATGVDFPGEAAGFSTKPSEWSKVQSYNVSFGQGITVTPLQITRFYGAIANDGVACTPHFLMSSGEESSSQEWPTEQVFEKTDALGPLVSMMQSVVSEGTGVDAQIEGFAPAGKTGTAEYVSEKGTYDLDSYNISFVGFLPDADSRLVCFVGVTEVPGDRITTPAFKDIMSFAMTHYGIAPDGGTPSSDEAALDAEEDQYWHYGEEQDYGAWEGADWQNG